VAAIPKKVTDRLSKEITKYKRILKKAADRDINESDTVAIITDILSDVFGFDKYAEVTSEYCIKNTYCDLAVKVDDKIKYLLEAKAIGLNLRENHLNQALSYGAKEGIPWVVLTNGIMWEIYRIEMGKKLDAQPICTFNMLEVSPRKTEDLDKLFILCKEGIQKDAIAEFHNKVQSVNRFTIGALVLSEPVLTVVRKELRKITPGLKVDVAEVEDILRTEVIKREVIEGDTASKAQSKVKRAMNKAQKKS